MKQFYETYKDDESVTPLVTQISWTIRGVVVVLPLVISICVFDKVNLQNPLGSCSLPAD